jgi:23S rRNA pseudouridine955/2504/2580 synthase
VAYQERDSCDNAAYLKISPPMLEFRVTDDSVGQRLDKFIRQQLPGVPKSHVYKMIRTKKIRVNGKRAVEGQLLSAGDQVSVRGTDETLRTVAPAKPPAPGRIEFRVLYEDDHVLACDKPEGLAVHTGTGIHGGTLVDQVRAYLGPRAERNGFLASPAHRLDRDTSGVILVAKSRRAMVRLTEIFTAGEAHKRYLALVKGRLPKKEGTIDIPLAEHQQTGRSRAEHGIKMQPALTHYRVVAASPEASLLECEIETGRTHQIRRHLAAIGHPVLGDRRHGDFPLNRELRGRWGLDRLFLHAELIETEHPIHGGRLRAVSPLPPSLEAVLKRAGVSLPAPATRARTEAR